MTNSYIQFVYCHSVSIQQPHKFHKQVILVVDKFFGAMLFCVGKRLTTKLTKQLIYYFLFRYHPAKVSVRKVSFCVIKKAVTSHNSISYGFLLQLSGRLDLNQRPLDPQSSALTGLRYAPT